MKQTFTVFTIFFFFSFSALHVKAQNQPLPPQADSIIAILPTLQGEEKLTALQELSRILARHPKDRYYLKMLKDEARRQNNVAVEGLAWSRYTLIFFSQFDTDSLFIVGEEALEFFKEHDLHSDILYVKNLFVLRHLRFRQVLTALRLAENAYEIVKDLPDQTLRARVLTMIGNIYFGMENWEESIRYYTESARVVQLRDSVEASDIGYAWERFYNLAYMARYSNRPNEMLHYVDSMNLKLRQFEEVHGARDANIVYFLTEYQTAIAYAELRQPVQAMQAIRRAKEYYSPEWDKVSVYYASLIDDMYGTYYLFAANNPTRAIEYLNRVLHYHKTSGTERGVLFTKTRLAQAHAKRGDYRMSTQLYREILQRRDSINKERFYAQVNEFRTIYELDKAELENQRQQAAIERQRSTIVKLIILGIALFLIAGLLLWSHNRIAKKNRGLYNQIKEHDRLAEELQQLRDIWAQNLPEDIEICDYDNVETHNCASLPPQTETEEQNIFLVRIREYLLRDRNFANPDLDVDKLPTQLKISRTYLYQKIKEATGLTLQDYINSLRLDDSRRLLGTTDEKIDVIAEMCGYNPRTFYRLFREKYDITPTVYRRMSQIEKNL